MTLNDRFAMSVATSRQVRFSTLAQNLRDPVIAGMMRMALADGNMLSLAAGFTDNEALPVQLVREIVDDLSVRPEGREALQYGMSQGSPVLREETLRFLSRYPGESGLAEEDPAHLMITNGSQQALYLAIQVLCDPGDIVLVEAPSYFVFLELLHGLGVQARSIPSLPDGRPDLPGLAAMLRDFSAKGEISKVKALYFNGYFANPSTRCYNREDKVGLLETVAAADESIAVIEDGAYRELAFDGPGDVPTITSLAESEGLPVMYTGTFTKPFATGIKVGYALVRDENWRRNLLRVKGHQDFGSSHFMQAILAEVLRRDLYEPHLQSIRAHYESKMKTLDQALREGGLASAGWKWTAPKGGLLMWIEGPEGTDTRIDEPFFKAAWERKVMYVPGNLCHAEGGLHHCVRLSFGALPEARLAEAGHRFAEAALVTA